MSQPAHDHPILPDDYHDLWHRLLSRIVDLRGEMGERALSQPDEARKWAAQAAALDTVVAEAQRLLDELRDRGEVGQFVRADGVLNA